MSKPESASGLPQHVDEKIKELKRKALAEIRPKIDADIKARIQENVRRADAGDPTRVPLKGYPMDIAFSVEDMQENLAKDIEAVIAEENKQRGEHEQPLTYSKQNSIEQPASSPQEKAKALLVDILADNFVLETELPSQVSSLMPPPRFVGQEGSRRLSAESLLRFLQREDLVNAALADASRRLDQARTDDERGEALAKKAFYFKCLEARKMFFPSSDSRSS